MKTKVTIFALAIVSFAVLLLLPTGASAMMSQCWNYDNDETTCSAQTDCEWHANPNNASQGWCDHLGCWKWDANQTGCTNAIDNLNMSCQWSPNNLGQDPWCPNDVGCCIEKGCWTWDDTNAATCENNTDNLECIWSASDQLCDPPECWTYDGTDEATCENNTIGMQCAWTAGSQCEMDTGCSDFDGNQDGCTQTNYCNWNATAYTCTEPSYVPPEFGEGATCWAFDFNPSACGNVTGCDYCNGSVFGNCQAGDTVGWCEGHGDPWDTPNDPIECADILTDDICECGPVQGCAWNGTGCEPGFSDCNLGSPPVDACDDTSNQTICNQLLTKWMMPCVWNSTDSECQFETSFVFGNGSGGFGDINDPDACIMAGGIWITETYSQNGVIQTDSWCESNTGVGSEDCDDSCWACEYQPDGSDWASVSAAQTACTNSELGFCQWQTDSYAFNGLGWCKQPDGITPGANCEVNCGDCQYMNSPQTACEASAADCSWNTDGWCEDANAQSCATDCFSCYSETDCETDGEGGDNACIWSPMGICKPSDFTGEICFDGIDNNNDGDIDCADADCMFDQFCGGNSFGDCGQNTDSATCNGTSTPMGNCTWIQEEGDDWGWCGMPGENCWQMDDDEAACNATEGCGYISGIGGCDLNETKIEACFDLQNSTACATNSNCEWVIDLWDDSGNSGWCDFVGAECFWNDTLNSNQAACEANLNCLWESDPFNPQGGFCDVKCFNPFLNESACNAEPLCAWQTSWCEPDFFLGGAGCPQYDGNQTACEANNATCVYHNGWCDDMFMFEMFDEMEDGAPVNLAGDTCPESGIAPASSDVCGLGMKDMGDSLGFGTMVNDMSGSRKCSGTDTAKFYWYLDTDGNTANNCAANKTDGSTDSGYEFLLKYEVTDDSGSIVETKVGYICSDGDWVPANIPLSTHKDMMCYKVNGGGVAVEKETFDKFSFYDSDEPMRIFATTANGTTGRETPIDETGPGWYTHGTMDFKFEDCFAPGQDMDGDGYTSENDPDCFTFKKFGFIPFEDCFSPGDDDGDGLTNCNDPDCAWDPYICGGDFEPDANDKTAPQIIWMQVETFPDAAFVMFDTNEPSNGTLLFYGTNSTCGTLSATVLDVGLIDPYMNDFKNWHDAPLDNFNFNPQALGSPLTNATTYYYKTQNCDPSGNCALSGCMSFTTENNEADCEACQFTVGFDFTPPAGAAPTDPLGNMEFKFDWDNDGTYDTIQSDTGFMSNYTQGQNASLLFENPNATTKWGIEFNNVNIQDLSNSLETIDSDDLVFNETTVDGETVTYVGMDSWKWQAFENEMPPATIELKIPGQWTDLWHCSDDLSSCTNKTAGAISGPTYNSTYDYTVWVVPGDWGFSVYGGEQYSAPSNNNNNNNGGGGGGGGGSSASVTTTTPTITPTPSIQIPIAEETPETTPEPAAEPVEEAPEIQGAAVTETKGFGLNTKQLMYGVLVAAAIGLGAMLVMNHGQRPPIPRRRNKNFRVKMRR